jgi:hypothetical protein
MKARETRRRFSCVGPDRRVVAPRGAEKFLPDRRLEVDTRGLSHTEHDARRLHGGTAMSTRRLALSVDKVAELLGTSRGLAYELVRCGQLSAR